jgi:4-amino-4-deoxy-L-arabinose transferase-like glycosyltransferase
MAAATSPSGGNSWGKIRRWIEAHPQLALALTVLAALGPFLAKPFNIDDPLFIWAAHQIQLHPGDPYGFDVNWYWTPSPMWQVTENPPLASYYIALAATILGWSETALHFAFLLPAVMVILGTYHLARHYCQHAKLAALLTLFTPVFLVSSTTVMCDVLMLAFWIWAILFWVEGMKQNSFWKLSGAGLLITLAALTKYYGVCLIPLLATHAMIEKRGLGRWCLCLLIPVAAMCAYQWVTQSLYGHALFSEAVDYAGTARGSFGVSKITTCLTALTFTGGCIAIVVFFAPLFWRAAGLVLIAFGLFAGSAMIREYVLHQHGSWAPVEFQMIFWTIGGAGVLALSATDVLHQRDSQSWLLALWLMGTFLFVAFFNWTVNGRAVLPMAPVVGILIVRRLERDIAAGRKISFRGVTICLVASSVFALLVARADYLLAVAVRQSARQVCAYHGSEPGRLWFQGHWGFQYYMEAMGASAVDIKHPALKPGDMLAVPSNNTDLLPPGSEMILLKTFTIPSARLLATSNARANAGFFFATVQGPLPFAFGRVPPESVAVYGLKTAASKSAHGDVFK